MDKLTRDQKFGQLLAIANVLSARVYEGDKPTISQKHLDRYGRLPRKTLEKIHAELMEYADQFQGEELVLLDLFGEVISTLDEEEFTNEKLAPRYLQAYYTQQNFLDNAIGVEEAARILGIAPGTVKNKCAAGEITAKKIGMAWVIDKSKLNKSSPAQP